VNGCPPGKQRRFATCRRLLLVAGIIFVLSATAGAGADDEWARAITRRDLSAIERLLSRDTQYVNQATKDGKTALMLAAGAGQEKLVGALLAAGADINSANTRGGTALMYAATRGDSKTVAVLLSHGAKVNARAENGWTAVTLASAKGYELIVKQLLAAGADANVADIYGWTPLMRAVEGDRLGVVRVLLEDKSVRVNARDDQGETALHHAAARGAFEIARMLIVHHADVQARDAAGRTPAMLATAEGHAGLADLITRSGKKPLPR
jgi:ankyrin repeat protein